MDEDPLGPDDLPFHADEQGASQESSETLLRQAARGEMTLRELEDRYVDLTLERTGGNKVQAARILGLDALRETAPPEPSRSSRAAPDAGCPGATDTPSP
jgi:DNA-binding NtrC family response regulator